MLNLVSVCLLTTGVEIVLSFKTVFLCQKCLFLFILLKSLLLVAICRVISFCFHSTLSTWCYYTYSWTNFSIFFSVSSECVPISVNVGDQANYLSLVVFLIGRLRPASPYIGGVPRGAYVGSIGYQPPLPYNYQQGLMYPSYGWVMLLIQGFLTILVARIMIQLSFAWLNVKF